MQALTRDETSLLLYLETCAVDQGGRVHAGRMDDDDHATALRWNAEGFVTFRRLRFDSIGGDGRTHGVRLSPAAWEAAHAARRARAERMGAQLDLVNENRGAE